VESPEEAVPLKLEIVTQERRVYSADDVEMVIAPGTEGEMGVLPHHAPLMTSLEVGVMRVKHTSGGEELVAIHGGFMEVLPDKVTVLADAAEHAEEIDVARAEESRRRAEETMKQHRDNKLDYEHADAALRRSLVRLKVGGGRRRRELPTQKFEPE
jgi:F-type H+-transporting ATPase subunit epsilon